MIESINWLINLFTWQKTMKPENPNASSNLKQINAEFDSFLTKLRVKIPNLQPGKVLKNPEIEKKRLSIEIENKQIIANKIVENIIFWAEQRTSIRMHLLSSYGTKVYEITTIVKALSLILHPDKLELNNSENAKYLKESLLHESNKGFYFDNVRKGCEEIKKKIAVKEDEGAYANYFPKDQYEYERSFFRADAQQWEESQRHQKRSSYYANQEVEWEKQRRAREQEIRDRHAKELEAYYNKQKEKKAGRSFLQNYVEDVAFVLHVLNREFLVYLCLGVIIMIAVLLLILISTISEIGLVVSLGMVVANAGEIAVSSLFYFAILFPIALPGLLATSWTAKQEGPPNQGFLNGYAFLIKLILLAPIAFVCFLFAEKSDLKSPIKPTKSKNPKNSRNIKKARKAKNVPPSFAPESESAKLSPDLSSQGSPSKLDNALPDAEVSSPRASVSPGYGNGADDCD